MRIRSWHTAGLVAAAFVVALAAASNSVPGAGDRRAPRDHGAAPEFAGIETWLNSEPLTMSGLKGKVVLVDFWTFACVNCARTLPYVIKWHDRYQRDGLVVVGMHTPEFPFERETDNLKDAIGRFGIHYPVAQDNRYATWNAYANHYWPALYLVDRNGTIVLTHSGEGDYEEIEAAIRAALANSDGAQSER